MDNKYILIDGFYGHSNLGDELIFDLINKAFKKKNQFIDLIKIISNVKNHPETNYVFKFEPSIKKILKIIYLIKNSKAIIIGGGGIFPSGLTKRHFFEAFFSKLFGKKLYMYNVSIDNIKYKFIWGIFISLFDVITVRDDYSLKKLTSYFPLKKIHKFSDIVFSIPKYSLKSSGSSKSILFNLAMPFLDLQFGTKDYNRLVLFVNEVFAFVKYLLSTDNSIKLIFNNFSRNTDHKLILLIQEKLSSINFNNYEINSERTKILQSFASSSFSVNMRFHSLILAILHNHKFINISYSQKSLSVIEQLGFQTVNLIYGISNFKYFSFEKDISAKDLIQKWKKMLIMEVGLRKLNQIKNNITSAKKGLEFIINKISIDID